MCACVCVVCWAACMPANLLPRARAHHTTCELCAHVIPAPHSPMQWVIYFACRGVLKTNTELTAALLPYVVQDVLTTRLEDPESPSVAAQIVRDELLAVLSDKWVASAPTSARGGGTADTSASHGTALQHKCTQAIFSLLDTLKQWNKPARDHRYAWHAATRTVLHAPVLAAARSLGLCVGWGGLDVIPRTADIHLPSPLLCCSTCGALGGGRRTARAYAEMDEAARGRCGYTWLMGQITRGLLADAAARCRAHARYSTTPRAGGGCTGGGALVHPWSAVSVGVVAVVVT